MSASLIWHGFTAIASRLLVLPIPTAVCLTHHCAKKISISVISYHYALQIELFPGHFQMNLQTQPIF
ncbi:hypothetical protein [Coleofasciculus sp. FACHB-SPT36]|uniref:hypothetical protein n=2 Tax=Cyanophyceae TaxID=3028117 RepID=UPI00168A79C7|nr:hypothetical protein [Coleofasciculus sp. FACHB-SPT36]MBD2540042.1 hypothetical protein [Coleofasciculus sp. FACHB-SPT36]